MSAIHPSSARSLSARSLRLSAGPGERYRAMHERTGSGVELSRRSFLKGTGAITAAAATIEATIAETAQALADADGPQVVGPGPVAITLQVNGAKRTLSVEPRATLVEALRGPLELMGAKVGCDRGACSACTVLVDGVPPASCSILAVDIGERPITSIEGLARDGKLHPVQAAFIAHDACNAAFARRDWR